METTAKNFFIIRVFEGKTPIYAREASLIAPNIAKYIKKPYKNQSGGYTVYIDIPKEEYSLTLALNIKK